MDVFDFLEKKQNLLPKEYENSKNFLRKIFREKRQNMVLTEVLEKSKKINEKLMRLFSMFIENLEQKNSKLKCMLYSDFDNEVKTNRIFEYCLENFGGAIFPKLLNEEISLFFVENSNNFEVGKFGILEPNESLCEKMELEHNFFYERTETKNNLLKNINEKINIVVVPGVIFDEFGNRIGFGRGYYDKFLEKLTNFYSTFDENYKEKMLIVGICYDFQIFKNGKINVSEKDYQMDVVITESNIYFGSDYRRRKDAINII